MNKNSSSSGYRSKWPTSTDSYSGKRSTKCWRSLNPQQRDKVLAQAGRMGPQAVFSAQFADGVSFSAYPNLEFDSDLRLGLHLSGEQQEKLKAISEKYSEMAKKDLDGMMRERNAGGKQGCPHPTPEL